MKLKRKAAFALLVGMLAPGASLVGPASAAPAITAWGTVASAPAGAFGELFGVAAPAADDAVAVGDARALQPSGFLGRYTSYAEHWNGTSWAATPVPAPATPYANPSAQLKSVSAAGRADAWAVGYVGDPSGFATKTLAYHWNGTAWLQAATPNPGGPSEENRLLDVAARSANDVWAVGDYVNYPARSLLLHWNGTAWAQVAVPNVGTLTAVAVDATNVWVAGGSTVQRLTAGRWTTLSAQPQPYVFVRDLAVSAGQLWVAGSTSYDLISGGVGYRSYASVWNGARWTVVGSSGQAVNGVAATARGVVAAIDAGTATLTAAGANTTEVTPVTQGVLNAVAVDPTGRAWAVGSNSTFDYTTSTGTTAPALITSPGIGQGGLVVAAGASGATVTAIGADNVSFTADETGTAQRGGLHAGTYTVITSFGGCTPGIATAVVAAGIATTINAPVRCP